MGTPLHLASIITLGLTLPAVCTGVALATPSFSSSSFSSAEKMLSSQVTVPSSLGRTVQETPAWYPVFLNEQNGKDDGYTPPNNGGPDSSQGSGTR
ncbi:hypothetical protein PN462_00430 [Spirulina sp. CS-785/01]|uniref:hypothetical protein n=1 Tax=Spirulina sp. CS-785/01 TaxID=3021716 RepID=UPI00232BCC27|nr:hypothetical protein [Spirulina sp. CS-785/01]MDB9311547.1 hypothetical protein [Spirulina sp. CS-785/01]